MTCKILFNCTHSEKEPCVYLSNKNDKCKFRNTGGVLIKCEYPPAMIQSVNQKSKEFAKDKNEIGYDTFRGQVKYISYENCECGSLFTTRDDFKIGDHAECIHCERQYKIVEGE